MTERSYVERIS